MPFFRLKAGSAIVADPDDPKKDKVLKATDADAILESDRDLAKEEPQRYEWVEAPAGKPRRAFSTARREPAPPGPPSDEDRAQADLLKPRTAAEQKTLAERLRQQAEQLEQAAEENEKAQKQADKEFNKANRAAAKDEEAEAQSEGTDFESMKVAELKDFAESNEVDLEGAHTKADIVAKLQDWEGGKGKK